MPDNEINIAALASYKIYPAKMGGQKGIALFYNYLSKLLPVTIISTKNNVWEPNERIRFIPALGNSRWRYINPFLFFTIRKIIKRNKISHLILEHPYYGWLGVLLRLFTKTKLVIHSHNIESLRFKSTGKWWWGILWHYEKLTHKKADLSFFIQDDDRNYAIEKFRLDPGKCFTITYGFEMDRGPTAEDKHIASNAIYNTYAIHPGKKIILFNGTLDYKPNRDALDIILQKINPRLLADKDLHYTIIICGNKLPVGYKSLHNYKDKNIVYAGFVDDITVFFKGADLFINPVTDGGGIKTKVVEALGYDCSVISTESGATGIPVAVTGDKLKIIADTDWEEFAKEIRVLNTRSSIPKSFFDQFYWGNIAATAAELISR
jgi:hypothetical protein